MPQRYMLMMCAVLLMLAMLPAAAVHAQAPGAIAGRIVDADTSEPIPGARIRLRGTSFRAIAGPDGSYRITTVPAGEYMIDVGYTGYVGEERPVIVRTGQATVANITIVSETYDSRQAVVRGERADRAWALNRIRNAYGLLDVRTATDVGRFPTRNVAEAMQDIPFMTVSRDTGEGQYVMLRGMRPEMTVVSVDGVRLLSPHRDERLVPLDGMFTQGISTFEVTGTPPPEMDADAPAGAVNLRSGSPRDFRSRALTGTFAGGLNTITGSGNGQAGLQYARRHGSLDVRIAGNVARSSRTVHHNVYSYGEQEIGGISRTVLDTFRTQDVEVDRLRAGLTASLEYAPDEKDWRYLRGMYNRLDDDRLTRSNLYLPGDGEYTGMRSVTGGGLAKHVSDSGITRQAMHIAAGGGHVYGDLLRGRPVTVDYQTAFSYAAEEEPDYAASTFRQTGVDMAWAADPEYPRMNVNAGAAENYAAYGLDGVTFGDNTVTARRFSGRFNVAVPLQYGGKPLEVKFGASARHETRESESAVTSYDWTGGAYTLDNALGSYTADDYMDGDLGDLGRYQDAGRVGRHFNVNRGLYVPDDAASHIAGDLHSYDGAETIIAAYGQGRYTSGALTVLTGLRVEQTLTDYDGFRVEVAADGGYAGTEKQSGSNDYFDVFPTVRMNYEYSDHTFLRAALTSAISRPAYHQLSPGGLVDHAGGRLSRGNPGLDPAYVTGLDAAVEHYFQPLGVVSALLFYKHFDNNRYERVSDVSGGLYDGYVSSEWVNGDAANLLGGGLHWSRQLTFLPGRLSGLGMQVNGTYVGSEATMDISGASRTTDMAGQSRIMGNAVVSYTGKLWKGCLSLNHRGSYLAVVGASGDEDLYIDSHTRLDLSLSRNINNNTGIFFEVRNITDEPYREYRGDESDPVELACHGRWIHLGVRTDF